MRFSICLLGFHFMLFYFIPSICFPSHVSRWPRIPTLPLPRHISDSGVHVQKSGARSKCSQHQWLGESLWDTSYRLGKATSISRNTLAEGKWQFQLFCCSGEQLQEAQWREGRLLLALLLNSVLVFLEPASAASTMEVGKEPAPTPNGVQKPLCPPICSPMSSLQPVPGRSWVTGVNGD